MHSVNISDFEIYFTQYQYTTSGLHVLCAWRIFCVQFLGAYCVFTYKIFERGDASPEEPPNLELPDLLMLSQASRDRGKMQPDLGQVSAHLWAFLGVKTTQT